MSPKDSELKYYFWDRSGFSEIGKTDSMDSNWYGSKPFRHFCIL